MYARWSPVSHESVYQAIGRWVATAPLRLLRVFLCWGTLGALGVIAIDMSQWYLGMGMIALAALGGWGLLEHRLVERPSARMQALEAVVSTVAVVAALVAILVALFVFMGPAPHF